MAVGLICLGAGLALAASARAAAPGQSLGRKYTSVERIAPERLRAAREDVERLGGLRQELPPLPGLTDVKAIFHAHAEDSRHTGGTLPEILADARRAGVRAIFLSDHFRPPRDFMAGWRGLRDGVLFVPGSETHGFLIHPEASVMEKMDSPPEALIPAIAAGDGLIFLCHYEDHPPEVSTEGLTGMEIYNRHADAKDDQGLLIAVAGMMTDPPRAAELARAVELFPDEVLAAQLDYPADYLRKWDTDTQRRPLTGVAANDCHHNQVFIIKMVDERTVRLGTIVDDDDAMRVISADDRPGILEMTRGRQPGDILLRLDFDPYYRSFYNVSTHILAEELTEPALRRAVKAGRVYVSHDWMADPTGFRYLAVRQSGGPEARLQHWAGFMGEELPLGEHLRLIAEFPLTCKARLIRNGEVLLERVENRLEYAPENPGVYRVEGWLTIDGEERPWIYSNPIYLR